MSREGKLALVVLGSLAGVALLGVAAAVVLLPKLLVQTIDARGGVSAAASTARKIARFRLPPGYHFGRSFDIGISRMVVVVPNDPRARFVIELESIALPGAREDDVLNGSRVGMQLKGMCSSFGDGRDESLPSAHGRPLRFTLRECADARSRLVEEYGMIPSSGHIAMLLAFGSQRDFDQSAVRALVRTVEP